MTTRIYGFTALTGGGTGALDKYPEAGMPALATDDYAIGHVSGVFYVYRFDGASSEAESAPDVIAPDSGSGRWLLKFLTMNHNDTLSMQGGNASPEEYYHLSSADYNALTDAFAQLTALQTDGSPTFVTETITTQIWKDATELTIASGAVTAAQTVHMIDTEADGATDDLVTINGGSAGKLLAIRAADGARTVVVKDGDGNILCGGADIVLDDANKYLLLFYDGALSKWVVVGGSGSGSGSSPVVSDTAYGTSWDGVTDVAPSKNAVYDQMQLQMLKTGSNLAIGSDADGDMYYRASSVLARLAKGAANLSLFMNAGATAPEWASGIKYGTFTRVTSVGSGDVSYTGVGFKPSAIIIISNFPSSGATSISIGFGTTDGNIYMQYVAGAGSVGSTNNIVNVGNGGTSMNYANLKSFDSDGFTLTWTKVGSPTSTATLGYLAFR